jgi:hypothetical protein
MSNVFVFRRPPHGVITEYFGGGKGGSTTTTNNVTQIPPEVLARYNAVNARAETVAQAPYQSYSQDPNAFVAPLSQTQQAGIQNTNAMAGAAQPYYGAATGLAAQSTGSVNPGGLNVGQYMNPYTQSVVNATQAAMNQQQAQQLSQQQTEAIRGGAFGGERAGLQRAALLGQQGLAQAQAIAPLYQQNYNQALAAAQQQQGVGLGAEQANRQNLQNAATLFGSIGTNAQQAGLAGAQAQLAAGQTQQQTQQAGLQALYNQFQQQQGFPYQQAQFLANIAEGTGALSGNATSGTSTTTGGGGFFSDERLKENIQRVGETDDGQPIYRYNYKGDKNTQIGLLAQDVEKHHPEAVGLAGGYKTVNYKKATEDAVHKEGGGEVSDAYSIGAPSAMLRENSGKGLGAMPSLPQAFAGGKDIPIEAGANAAGLAAMRSPAVTGFAPGVREGKQAELDSLLSTQANPGPNGAVLGSGPGYVSSRIGTLQDWLNKNQSQGGLVSGPGNFARGGLADGDYMNPALAYYSPQQAQQGVFQLQPVGQHQILRGDQMQAPQQKPQQDPIAAANQAAGLALTGSKIYDWAKKPSKDTGYDNEWTPGEENDADTLIDLNTPVAARGGLIAGRHHYSRGGINPYSGLGGNDILGPIIEQQDTSLRIPGDKGTPAPSSKPQQSGGLGELAQMASAGKNLYKGGEWAAGKLGLGAPETAMSATSAEALPEVIDLTSGAGIAGAAPEALSAGLAGGEALAGGAAAAEGAGLLGGLTAAAAPIAEGIGAAAPFLLGFLSDERAKHDIKKVGELYDGQPVYRFKYNGDDRTQIGLLAQKVEKGHPEAVGLAGGMKTVDYKRATDDAAKRHHFEDGGFEPGTSQILPADPAFDPNFDEPQPLRQAPVVHRGVAPPPETTAVAATPRTTEAPAPRAREPEAPRAREPGVASSYLPDFSKIVPEGAKDTLSSENFWVPAIAGLGAMLASPNKTLAGAIGSGLVGGTGAYTGLQKQQSEIAKNSLDIFNKVFEKREDGEGNVSYMNLQTGKPATPQEAFGFLRNMPGFSGLAKTPTTSAREAPQRDPTVALASDVVDKGVEPVTPRAAAAPPAGGAARTAAGAPAEAPAVTPGAPAAGTQPVPSARPTAAAKPEEGEQPTVRIPEDAQAEILKADAWARSQPDVKAHLDEAKLQSSIADRAQALMKRPVTPENRANLAKQFEAANTQAREAASRAEAAVTRLTAPLYTDISRQLGVSPQAVAGAARMEAGKARAVLATDIVAGQAEAAGAKTRAERSAESESELVEVMRPNGSTAYVSKAKVLAGEKPVTPGAGTPPGEVANNTTPDNLKSLPAASLKMREDIGKDELKMSEDYQRRQVAQSRVNGLLDIMTQYETGKFADTKGEIVGKLRGIGINVKDTDTASPAKFEIFMKGAIKNVFDDLPGGKILLAEISGLSRANANSTMQPEANAKILGDALAAVKYEDKYVLDYAKWRQENPNAYSPMDTIRFNEQWLKNNNLDAYKKETARHIGYIGQNLPAKLDDAVHGQRYYIPQTKELRYFDKTFVNPNGSKGGWAKSDPLAGSAAQ